MAKAIPQLEEDKKYGKGEGANGFSSEVIRRLSDDAISEYPTRIYYERR